MAINDNVYKNLDKFSLLLYDQDLKRKKNEYSAKQKSFIVDKLIEKVAKKNEAIETLLFRAIDRILCAHRNVNTLFFLTSAPFFLMAFGLKYFFKFSFLGVFYHKNDENDEKLNADEKVEEKVMQ